MFLYIIVRVTVFCCFFVSIIGYRNCSCTAIFCTFIIQLFNTFSLSPSCALDIKNISFMVFIKQLKQSIFVRCKCCYRTGALPCKGRVVGYSPLWDWNFFSSFLFFLCFPYTDCAEHLPRCMRICGQGPARLSAIDFNRKDSSIYLAYGSTSNRSNCFDQYIKRIARK